MEKEKVKYTIKKTLCSFGLASVLLMTGCNKLEDNNQSIGNEATIVSDDNIVKQEVKISINANNVEELIDSLKELENDLPTIIIDNKVIGLEISYSSNMQRSPEAIELIKDIATSCPDLTSLSIPGLYLTDEDVNWISSLINLTDLDINANFGMTDISFAETLSNLENLDISNTNVEDLSCLTNLTNLKSLEMACTSINNYSIVNLADLPNLTYLNIFGCHNLSSNYTSWGHYDSRKEIEELIDLIKEDEKGYRLIFN